jgi:cardiolipin synthase
MHTPWPLPISPLQHGIFIACGLLLYILITRIGEQRRHPSAAIAWVLAIVAFPYAAIPLFLIFGTRKIRRPAPTNLAPCPFPLTDDAAFWASRLLRGLGVADAVHNASIRFHADGPQSHEALLQLFNQAEQRLDVSTYVLGNGRVSAGVVDALLAAVTRGVEVRLLIDWVGSLKTSRRLLSRLRAGGVELRQFMPLLHNPMHGRTNLRNHRKLAVADGRYLWSGGRNLADEYFLDQGGQAAWPDLSFVIDGSVAAQAAAQFEQDWQMASGRRNTPPAPRPGPAPSRSGALAQWVPSGPDQGEDTVHSLLIASAHHARHRILAVSPYFVPDEALLNAWCTACRCGVQLCLLVPQHSNHRLADWARERALRRLVEAGAQVYLSPTMVHAKAVVIDNHLALCGSVNLDSRSLFLNYEAMTAFYGSTEVDWLAQWIQTQVDQASPYPARRPNWWRELVEGLVIAVVFQL